MIMNSGDFGLRLVSTVPIGATVVFQGLHVVFLFLPFDVKLMQHRGALAARTSMLDGETTICRWGDRGT